MFMKLICIIIILVLNSRNSRINANSNVNDRNENFMKLLENTSQPFNLIANDLIFLSELPLDKLLKVKKSIEEIQRVKSVDENEVVKDEVDDDDDEFEDGFSDKSRKPLSTDVEIAQQRNIEGFITPLPLVNNPPYNRKTGYGVEQPWDTPPSKIQKFFQISVTALAFLAFAGYLLCMIVQAIKSKGTTYLHTSMANMANGVTGSANINNINQNQGSVPLRKRRPGRRRRNVFLSADNKNDTLSSIYEDSLASPDPDQMYHVMLMMAEGYVNLNYLK